ncbi:hypothetical protein HUJ05_001841, partial [Dendroctonus ponderosae]
MCILLFDEMAIQANLAYKRYNDKIIGLEDYGGEKRAVLSDHANVFMLRDMKDKNSLSPDAVDTADLILFLDQLFDSLNVLKSNKS